MTGRAYLPNFAPKRPFHFFVCSILLLSTLVISSGAYLPNFVSKIYFYFFASCTPLLATLVILVKRCLAYIKTISRYWKLWVRRSGDGLLIQSSNTSKLYWQSHLVTRLINWLLRLSTAKNSCLNKTITYILMLLLSQKMREINVWKYEARNK